MPWQKKKNTTEGTKNVYAVGDWGKTENPALFYNIELIDTAIEQKCRIGYDYNKIGIDKKLHRSSRQAATPLSAVPGYENGPDYRKLAFSMPYMYSDEPVRITFLADVGIVDQIVDWFGSDVRFLKCPDEGKVEATVTAGPKATEH